MLSPEQLALRKHHITGTDIARIAGISPFGGPLTVYAEKKGLIEQAEPSAVMERGTYLEDGLLRWYADKTARTVAPHKGLLIHKIYPLIGATPDAISFNEVDRTGGKDVYLNKHAVEAKAPTPWTQRQWGEEGTDNIPEHYIPQAIFEAAVADVDQTDVIADIGTALKIFPVMYDEELFQGLREIAEKFQRDHVVKGVAPRATAADMGVLRTINPTAKIEDYVEADSELVAEITLYRELLASAKSISDGVEHVKAHLIQVIGDKSGIRCPSGRIDFKNNKPSVVVLWEKVAKEAGASNELIARYTSEKPGARPFYPRFNKETK
jgi:putative phage-type endonuclease